MRLVEMFHWILVIIVKGCRVSLTTRDREQVSVLEARIEPGDLNRRPLTPQSVTLQLYHELDYCKRFHYHTNLINQKPQF